MDLNKILPLITKYAPAGLSIMNILGEPQKAFLNQHADKMSPFLETKDGQEALQLFLVEFCEYVLAQE